MTHHSFPLLHKGGLVSVCFELAANLRNRGFIAYDRLVKLHLFAIKALAKRGGGINDNSAKQNGWNLTANLPCVKNVFCLKLEIARLGARVTVNLARGYPCDLRVTVARTQTAATSWLKWEGARIAWLNELLCGQFLAGKQTLVELWFISNSWHSPGHDLRLSWGRNN